MPIYEYECKECGQRVETLQRVSDPPLSTCETCGGDLKRLLSPPAFRFKGSGWYVTDYAGKGKKEPKESSESGDDSGGAKDDVTSEKKKASTSTEPSTG